MPQSPDKSNRIPSTLYNGMMNTLVPYAIKGAIWYQGESNLVIIQTVTENTLAQ